MYTHFSDLTLHLGHQQIWLGNFYDKTLWGQNGGSISLIHPWASNHEWSNLKWTEAWRLTGGGKCRFKAERDVALCEGHLKSGAKGIIWSESCFRSLWGKALALSPRLSSPLTQLLAPMFLSRCQSHGPCCNNVFAAPIQLPIGINAGSERGNTLTQSRIL